MQKGRSDGRTFLLADNDKRTVSPQSGQERQKKMIYSTTPKERRSLMFKLALRYARYALSALATIGFGLN
jgi:hypothetical protein